MFFFYNSPLTLWLILDARTRLAIFINLHLLFGMLYLFYSCSLYMVFILFRQLFTCTNIQRKKNSPSYIWIVGTEKRFHIFFTSVHLTYTVSCVCDACLMCNVDNAIAYWIWENAYWNSIRETNLQHQTDQTNPATNDANNKFIHLNMYFCLAACVSREHFLLSYCNFL